MPEAAVHKYRQARAEKHDVGGAAACEAVLDSVANAGCPKGAPESKLWRGIALAASCEVSASVRTLPGLIHVSIFAFVVRRGGNSR